MFLVFKVLSQSTVKLSNLFFILQQFAKNYYDESIQIQVIRVLDRHVQYTYVVKEHQHR